MEMRQIECFLACREHRSFTAAARSLNLVQSAVSTSVAKLELELGARLFDRTPRALELTEAGRAMVEPARSMLHARRDIVDAIDLARGQVRGEVVICDIPARCLERAAEPCDAEVGRSRRAAHSLQRRTRGHRCHPQRQPHLTDGQALSGAGSAEVSGDPADVVRTALDGIEQGRIEILADDCSAQIKAGPAADPSVLYPRFAPSA